MKDYIIELVTGKAKTKSRVKAMTLDNLRARIVKEGLLRKEEKVVVYSTRAQTINPDTPFNLTGVIWIDNYNGQVFWMDTKGKVSNVTSDGSLGKFKIGA